jgi:hypothetical protein
MIISMLQLTSCKQNSNEKVMSSSNVDRPRFNIQVGPDPISIQIPFELNGLMPVIDCQLNGITCRMMLDTGSETIGLFENKLDKFSLKTNGNRHKNYSASGYHETDTIEEFILEFAGHIRIVANNCGTLSTFSDKPDLDGVLGGPAFVHLNAIIDYEQNTVTLNTDPILHKTEPNTPRGP